MIKSFACKQTRIFWERGTGKRLPEDLRKRAFRKLQLIDAAADIEFLRLPPSNNLEKLSGNMKHKFSIRINRQYRIVFSWIDGHAENVEIIDYH